VITRRELFLSIVGLVTLPKVVSVLPAASPGTIGAIERAPNPFWRAQDPTCMIVSNTEVMNRYERLINHTRGKAW
jgi:hypothetical protein